MLQTRMVFPVCKLLNETSICKNHHGPKKTGYRSISQGFVPNEVEEEVSAYWQSCSPHPMDNEAAAKAKTASKFSMILPPPNVTGTLHLGHALTTTLQDVLAKRARMKGDEVVWVPGLDHAGIATQAIVESVLLKSGLDIKQMPREALLDQLRSWKASKSEIILHQLKQLTPSLNWSRQFFTLDQNQSRAVKEAFKRLYSAGLIYRSERLVNWCVSLGSAISDMEVEYKLISGPTHLQPPSARQPVTFGQMTDVAFKLRDRLEKEIVISTCRLETMPGDVAVAVHPEDSRYFDYHGCFLIHPLTGRFVPIILDPAVDPSFGTGAVKVTPGHDQTDFEMATRHKLDIISVIDEKGKLTSQAADYAGLDRFEGREVIAKVLSQRGLIRAVKDHKMSVPLCSRTKDVIELLSRPQWFLKCKEMGHRALEAVEEGRLKIIPEQYNKNWVSYLGTIRDWCISRQVIWGHRIPLYMDGEENFFLVGSDVTSKKKDLRQVEDVLDTWFSSALLPFSAFGWPHNDADYKRYFPLDLMVTGHDILFFWVARMVMLSLQLTDQLPFKRVLLHSVICDPQGRKMSKSLGNVINPQHVIQGISHQELLKDIESRVEDGTLKKEEEDASLSNVQRIFPEGIPQCGVDALRMSLLSQKIKNHYVNFDTDACYVNKLFCNKLWQACKFTLTRCSETLTSYALDRSPTPTSKLDLWLIGKFNRTLGTVNKSLDDYEFHVAVNSIKEFLQHYFCDIYLEGVKVKLRKTQDASSAEICYTLLYCLTNVVKLLAPMAPFVTDKLYRELQPQAKMSVHFADWPTDSCRVKLTEDIEKVDKEISYCLNAVKEIRRLKLEMKTSSQDHLQVGLKSEVNVEAELINLIKDLTGSDLILMKQEESGWNRFSTLSEELSIFYFSRQKTEPVTAERDLAKVMKLEMELNKIVKMRSHEAYKIKVAESVQKAHSDKIVKLQHQIDLLKTGK